MATQLKKLLIERGERQYTVAQRASLTETRLSRIACGRAEATPDERKRIAVALGLKVAQIFDTEQGVK